MKTKMMKLLLILTAMIFLGAGTAVAQDRHGDRNHWKSGKHNAHFKGDRHQKGLYGKKYRKHFNNKHHGRYSHPRYFSKHHRTYGHHGKYYKHHQRRHHRHYRHYRGASGYPALSGFSFGLAVVDPNVAFSLGVNGH